MPEEMVKFTPSLGRFLRTIDDFKAEYGVWPTQFVIGEKPYKQLIEESFSTTTWKLVEEKLRIIVCAGTILIALDEGRFSGYLAWDSALNLKNEGMPATEWIGIRRAD